MTEQRVQRRLAAILAADVAGYSRLIGTDEEGTLNRLKEYRKKIIDPKIATHQGRVVKLMGDGILIEFSSAVAALRCAVEMQRAIGEHNAGETKDRRIEFRVGLHQGNVVVEGGDILGDGVNVAARLQALAEPGTIFVSQRIHEDAGEKRMNRLIKEHRPDGLPETDAIVAWLKRSIPSCRTRNLLAHGIWWEFDTVAGTITVRSGVDRESEDQHRPFTVADIQGVANSFDDLEVELWKLQRAVEARPASIRPSAARWGSTSALWRWLRELVVRA